MTPVIRQPGDSAVGDSAVGDSAVGDSVGRGTGEIIDVLVIGGGPVGLSTAVHAGLAGLRAVVLEPRAGEIDKACGEGLMPGAVASLANIGVDPTGAPMRGITYTDGTRSASADFSVGPGRGVRRTELHRRLRERAREVGVQILPAAMASLTQDASGVDVRLRGPETDLLRARYVIGADGLHSRTRRQVGAERPPSTRRRYGFRQHYSVAPWTDRVEVHWGREAEVYITPVSAEAVGVAVLTSQTGSFVDHLSKFPGVARRIEGSQALSSVRAAGPLSQPVRNRTHGRVLLVGDAGGYVDALTGEGLSVGLAQSEVAVRAICARTPARYESMARAVSWRSTVLTTGLLQATRVSLLRRAIVPAAAQAPWLFRRAVNELAATGPSSTAGKH